MIDGHLLADSAAVLTQAKIQPRATPCPNLALKMDEHDVTEWWDEHDESHNVCEKWKEEGEDHNVCKKTRCDKYHVWK